jgi:hypothetical protein
MKKKKAKFPVLIVLFGALALALADTQAFALGMKSLLRQMNIKKVALCVTDDFLSNSAELPNPLSKGENFDYGVGRSSVKGFESYFKENGIKYEIDDKDKDTKADIIITPAVKKDMREEVRPTPPRNEALGELAMIKKVNPMQDRYVNIEYSFTVEIPGRDAKLVLDVPSECEVNLLWTPTCNAKKAMEILFLNPRLKDFVKQNQTAPTGSK